MPVLEKVSRRVVAASAVVHVDDDGAGDTARADENEHERYSCALGSEQVLAPEGHARTGEQQPLHASLEHEPEIAALVVASLDAADHQVVAAPARLGLRAGDHV